MHRKTIQVVSALDLGLSIISASLINFVVNAEEEEEEEADGVVTSMDTICTSYKMEIGHDKTKIMPNNPGGCQREIKMRPSQWFGGTGENGHLFQGNRGTSSKF